MTIDPRLHQHVDAHPHPLLFVTISGAHLYGFPSPDSDFDLRGELQQAFDNSTLPEAPGGAAALNDLLVRLRLKTGRSL